MLLLNINRKPYMGSPMTLSHLTLVTLKVKVNQISKHISRKGAELGHMLLCNINRNPYMRSPMTLAVDLEWPYKIKVTLRFRNLISHKGAKLGHMLLLNIYRIACMGSPLAWLHWTYVTLKGQWDFEDISRKSSELGHVLLLSTNRNSYMVSSTSPLHLTLSDFER